MVLETFPPAGAVKVRMQQGVQMFMIPNSKATMSETLEHSIGSNNSIDIDMNCHAALKNGGLSSLASDGSMSLIALPSSPMPAMSSGSMASTTAIPLPAVPTPSEADGLDDDDEMNQLALKVRKGEVCIKVGLALLPQLAFIEQDF